MALTKIKTKDLARSAALKRSRRRRIVFLSTSNPSRFFDERIGRHPSSSSSSKSKNKNKNKHALSATTMAASPPAAATKTDANPAYISSAPESHLKSLNQPSKAPKKTRPEISLIKKREQEASSETSESSSSSIRPPSVFDRDEVCGKTGPIVDTPPSSPASETALDGERKRVLTKQEKREAKKQASLQQSTTSSEKKQVPTKEEKREAKKQASSQQQESTTSTPDPKPKTKPPVEQAKSKKESAKPQVSSAQKDARKPNKTAGQSRPGKNIEMADNEAQRQQFLNSLDRRWPNDQVGGCGLYNPGVFCYRRSVLQCLLNIPVFVNWLSGHRRGRNDSCPGQSRKKVQSKWVQEPARACLACALLGLAKAYWTPEGNTRLMAATKYFDQTVEKIAMSTCIYPVTDRPEDLRERREELRHSQQDAGEFFRWIFEALEQHGQMPQQELRNIFQYRMTKARQCPHCKAPDTTVEGGPLMILPGSSMRNSLETYFVGFLGVEKLPPMACDNPKCKYNAKSKDRVRMQRQNRLVECPEILVIQPNRSSWDSRGGAKKLNHAITFPPVLDLTQHLDPQSTERTARYSLSGVAHHWGNTVANGHYYATSVTPKGVRQLNDSRVSSSDLQKLLRAKDGPSTPFLLFYTRLRDGQENPLSKFGLNAPTGNGKASSSKTGAPSTAQPSTSGSLKRSDAGFQKKRKFSDAQPTPGFKKHKQNNHRSNKF